MRERGCVVVVVHSEAALTRAAPDAMPLCYPSLPLQENATEIVRAFAQEHGLPAADSTQILRAILRQGTEGRFLPALEFPVTLNAGEGAQAAEEMFRLYQVTGAHGTDRHEMIQIAGCREKGGRCERK